VREKERRNTRKKERKKYKETMWDRKVYHLSMVEVVCSFLKLTLDIYPIKISMQQESLCVKKQRS
jgi:hypothetical protein